jgi:hypothetical protein
VIRLKFAPPENKTRQLKFCTAAFGTTFSGTIENHKESIYLVCFSGVIDLLDPTSTWSLHATLTVFNYQEVDLEMRIVSAERTD